MGRGSTLCGVWEFLRLPAASDASGASGRSCDRAEGLAWTWRPRRGRLIGCRQHRRGGHQDPIRAGYVSWGSGGLTAGTSSKIAICSSSVLWPSKILLKGTIYLSQQKDNFLAKKSQPLAPLIWFFPLPCQRRHRGLARREDRRRLGRPQARTLGYSPILF